VAYALASIKWLCCSCCYWKKSERIPLNQQIKYTKAFKPSDSYFEDDGQGALYDKLDEICEGGQEAFPIKKGHNSGIVESDETKTLFELQFAQVSVPRATFA